MKKKEAPFLYTSTRQEEREKKTQENAVNRHLTKSCEPAFSLSSLQVFRGPVCWFFHFSASKKKRIDSEGAASQAAAEAAAAL